MLRHKCGRMSRHFSIRCVAAVLMAALLFAQEPAPVRVNVRLVQVNVIVRDRSGNPVTGLSKDDFEITDNDKPQKISFFEGENAVVAKSPAPLPANVFSNRIDAETQATSGITVVLFDLLNTAFADQVSARDRLVQVLRQIPPGQRIGVYALLRELTILHDFTDNPAQLAGVLEQLQGQTSHALTNSEEAPLPKPIESPATKAALEVLVHLTDGAQRVSKDYYNLDRGTITLNAIEMIANHLASTTGRKNLIWISGSFPFTLGLTDQDLKKMKNDSPNRQRGPFEGPFEQAMRAVSNANMAIYPVDARGLMALADYDAGTAMAKTSHTNPDIATTHMENMDTIENLASKSGGQAFFNTNDLQKAVRTALDDGRMTYTLGFYPEPTVQNKFHTLKVQVNRKDVTLRYRQGYFAVGERPADINPNAVLRELLASPLDASSIGITAELQAPTANGGAWTVNPVIDSDDLALDDRAGRRVGQLQIVYSVQDKTGKELAGVRDEVNLDVKPAVWKVIQAKGLALQKQFTPPANATTIRIAVYDPGSGRSGCVSVPLNPN